MYVVYCLLAYLFSFEWEQSALWDYRAEFISFEYEDYIREVYNNFEGRGIQFRSDLQLTRIRVL